MGEATVIVDGGFLEIRQDPEVSLIVAETGELEKHPVVPHLSVVLANIIGLIPVGTVTKIIVDSGGEIVVNLEMKKLQKFIKDKV